MGAAQVVAFEMSRDSMTTIAEAKTPSSLILPSPLLQQKIAALRRRQVFVSAGTGASLVAAVFLVLLAIAMGLDWWLDLSRGARVALLALDVGTVAYVVVGHVWQPHLVQ